MQLRNSEGGYGLVALWLHWSSVALVAIAWLLGTFGDDLPRGAIRDTGLRIHIAAGLAIIGVVLIRVVWRFIDPPPPFEPTRLGHWLEIVARLSHWALYGLVLATPIIGVLLQFARGQALPVFGFIDIASPWVRDRALAGGLKEVHEVLANLLMIAAGLHATAALAHHWLFRDRTLTRMLPGGIR